MPRIVPHAILPVKTAGEVKGRDFFTLSGKSQRLSLQDVGNASVQPTSLKGSTPRMKGTLLMSALGLGAAACLPPVAATAGRQTALQTGGDRTFRRDDGGHPLLPRYAFSGYAPPLTFRAQPRAALPSAALSHSPHAIKKSFRGAISSSTARHSSNTTTTLFSLANSRLPSLSRRQDEKGRTTARRQAREAKAARNEGDIRYWRALSPSQAGTTNDVYAQNDTVSAGFETAVSGHHWLEALRDVSRYCQDYPPTGYVSLATNRLESARILYSMYEQAKWADERLFSFINQQLDPAQPGYSAPFARKILRVESALYYVQSRIIGWDLRPAAPDFEPRFLTAHAERGLIFTPETIIDFYLAQFNVLTRAPAKPFKTRNQLNDLTHYYAQFTEYLNHHALDDVVAVVAQTTAYMGISALDLERAFTPLFSARIGHYRSALLPQTGAKSHAFEAGSFIFIFRGHSGKRYAASNWGAQLAVAEISRLLPESGVTAIRALADSKIISADWLPVEALVAALWPGISTLNAGKLMIMKKYKHALQFNVTEPTLFEALIAIQYQVVKDYIAAWRDQHLDKNLGEKFLSFVPFYDTVQRKIKDSAYHPTLGELAFDLFDLGITLLALGIPLIKLGARGIKIGMATMKAGRAAGMSGKLLQQQVFSAVRPLVNQMGRVTGREIAGFVLPPFDLLRLIRKPLVNGGRRFYHTLRTALPKRCKRGIWGTCFPHTRHVAAFDVNEWEAMIGHLVYDPASWKGSLIPRAYRHEYIRRFIALSADQKEALRSWSYVPWQKHYLNYPQKKSWPAGTSNKNFELNNALLSHHPRADMLLAANNLSSALKGLPEMLEAQSLVRVVDIGEENMRLFRAGDVVSNYPAFMSASSKGKLVNVALSRGFMFFPKWLKHPNAAIAIYHITSRKGKPLIKRLTTQVGMEGEYLFDQKSFFRVQAVTSLYLRSRIRTKKQVFFIKLEEIAYDNTLKVKNIFSGNQIKIPA